jgi:HD domain-containing protein
MAFGPPRRAHAYGLRCVPRLLSCAAVVVALAAVVELAREGVVQPWPALAFGLAIAFGEALRVALPGGRDSAPIAETATLGYVMAFKLGPHPALYPPVEVVAVVAAATLLGTSVQTYAGRPPQSGYMARRVLTAALAAVTFRGWLLDGTVRGLAHRHEAPQLSLVLAGFSLATVIVSHLIAVLLALLAPGPVPALSGPPPGAVFPYGSGRGYITWRRVAYALVTECRSAGRVYPTVILFGTATTLATGPLGLWALPLAIAPILVVQRSLHRYAAISATYQQTIRALSRVTDLAGYTEPGHARRVCHLALAIGRDLSLDGDDLLDLEYAALLHDIGQLSLTDPIPGGATVLIAPEWAASVALLGADVVRQTGVLDRVADILESQADTYSPDRSCDSVRLAGSIIRAANAYDDLVGGALDPDRRLAAVQRIRLGIAVEYDPRVVESLTRIVESTVPYPG